jgi:hypothetical protein
MSEAASTMSIPALGAAVERGGPVLSTPADLSRPDIWAGVDRLIDRAPSRAALRAHGLHLLAARRWRELGLELPDEVAHAEHAASCLTLTAPLVLRRVRDAYDGQLIVLKGPEVAVHYPDACRPSWDLDILADNPESAQRALLSAGFEPLGSLEDGYYAGLHHLRPLHLPGSPVPSVEIHRHPNWLEWSHPPKNSELFAAAVPGSLEIEGLLALPPSHHALVLAAHSWVETPLRRILDLIDVLAESSAEPDREAMRALARRWGVDRVWSTILAAAEALVLDTAVPWSLRTWARNLREVRDRTVLENHIRTWMSPFWALPAHTALKATAVAVARDVTPAPEESWGDKLGRAGKAIRNPSRADAEHARVLGAAAHKGRFTRR